MFCQICSFYESDNTMIEYSCGHAFHRRCMLPNQMSLILPKCKICLDGVYLNEDASYDDYECNECYAPRNRLRSESEFSDIWNEVNEYRDISATCVAFMGILSVISIVMLVLI